MPSLLDEVRDNMGTTTPRRYFFPGKKGYDPVLPAPWFPRQDELYEVYQKQDLLLREGEIVWGAFVQTNKLLMQRGRFDHPANVIWSARPEIEADPTILANLASRLFELKTTPPKDSEERQYAMVLSEEINRGMGVTVPRSYSGVHHPVKSTTIMVIRRHLPTNVIMGTLVPLLTHFTTNAALIVPWKYWPRALVHQWREIFERSYTDQKRGKNIVTITSTALGVIRDMARDAYDPWYVRILVRKRNDQGLAESFAVKIDERVSRRYDYLFDQDGLELVIDQDDVEDIEGAIVDYQSKAGRGGFHFQFP